MGRETSNYEIIEFDPKTASRQEWARVHEYRRARLIERDRLNELLPDDDYEAQAKRDSPFGESKNFLVRTSEGEVVGWGYSFISYPTAPGYDSNKHLLDFYGAVLKPHRRKGIGTRLLKTALLLMEEHDKSILTLGTEEDEGRGFLLSIGAEEKFNNIENRLALNEVVWDMVSRWVKGGRERNPETELVFYENRIPEEQLADFSKRYSELLNTVPFQDLDHGEIVISEGMMKEQYERFDQLKLEHHTYLIRELDGVMSGVTDIQWRPQTPWLIGQNLTAVHPDYQGRGYGKWLKASMLEFIRSRYPEATHITTGNANSNEPMLAINHKLGFKKHSADTAYQISREDLSKYLSSH